VRGRILVFGYFAIGKDWGKEREKAEELKKAILFLFFEEGKKMSPHHNSSC
jgi:hypothetical protein